MGDDLDPHLEHWLPCDRAGKKRVIFRVHSFGKESLLFWFAGQMILSADSSMSASIGGNVLCQVREGMVNHFQMPVSRLGMES